MAEAEVETQRRGYAPEREGIVNGHGELHSTEVPWAEDVVQLARAADPLLLGGAHRGVV